MNLFVLRYADGIKRRIARFGYAYKKWKMRNDMPITPLEMPFNAWFSSTFPILIAHSGGGFNGYTYTNSKETIEQSIKNGYRVIEVDICITSDGVPVLSHDFKPDHENLFDEIPTLEKFLKTPMDSGLTLLTFEDFLKFIKEWDGTILLDIRHTYSGNQCYHYESLLKWLDWHPLPKMRSKVLFQIHSPEIAELFFLRGFTGKDLHCNFPFETLETRIPWMVKHQLQTLSIADCFFCKENEDIFKLLKTVNITYFAHTINHNSRVHYLAKFGVSGMFTDRLIPTGLN